MEQAQAVSQADQQETRLVEAAAELLSTAMSTKAQALRPVRVKDLALVLSSETVAVVYFLDTEQRITSLQAAIRKLNGYAFVYLSDGFIALEGEPRHDALLLITGTRDGRRWTATATPYRHESMGAMFDPTREFQEMADAYRVVFQ